MGIIHTFTEGGQIWSHRFRMFKQVTKITLSTSFLVGLAVFFFLLVSEPMQNFSGAWYYSKSYLLEQYVQKIDVDSEFWEQVSGHRYPKDSISIPLYQVKRAAEPYAKLFINNSQKALEKSAFASNITLILSVIFFLIYGFGSKSKKLVSGKKIVNPRLLALKLKVTLNASKIHIGSTHLVKGSENQHILITGGTGTGKTNCLHHILKQIRQLGQKAVIVDTTGAFVEKYYSQATDHILSPFHPNRVKWHPWAECENIVDYAGIAEAFIPHSNNEHDNYWRQASRTYYSSLLQKLSNNQKNSEIVKWIMYEPLDLVCQLLAGTKAASHMDPRSEKTASSVRSVASTYLECLENLDDTDTPFSVKNWIADPKETGWLFIQCSPSERSAVRPLLSAWISSAIRGLLSLQPDPNRRIWFVIDELPSLQKVKDIELLLTEGRKYGGCGVLSLQSPAQLESVYGRECSKVIIGNTLTKIVFSEQDPEIASRISNAFGEHETKERQEGISYGAHEARDGVNLSSHTTKAPLIPASLIMSLPNHTAYIKLPGNYPIVKQKLKIAKI